MPVIGGDNWKFNRRELYNIANEESSQGNRIELIQPNLKEEIIQPNQLFIDKGIPGSKIGPIVDTSNAGITSIGDLPTDIRFWAGSDFAGRATAPFRVDKAGNLIATSAIINGRAFTSDPTFGDGSDGDVTISADTTLARDMFYDHLVISDTGSYSETTNPIVGVNGDGSAGYNTAGSSWATFRAGAGTVTDSGTATTLQPKLTATAINLTLLQRTIIPFTNTLPATSTAVTAKVRFYVDSKVATFVNQSLSLVYRTDAGGIAAADYNIANWTMTKLAADLPISGITTSAYNEFTLNATGIALLQANLATKITFGIVLTCDADNADPGKSSSGTQEASVTFQSADGTNKPQLLINYTRPNPTIFANGFRIFAKTSITNDGQIDASGASGSNGVAGGNGANAPTLTGGTAGTGGAGETSGTDGGAGANGQFNGGSAAGLNGNASSAGTAGGTSNSCVGSNGVIGIQGGIGGVGGIGFFSEAGGTSPSPGAAGAAGVCSAPGQSIRNTINAVILWDSSNAVKYSTSAKSGGSTGGSGGGTGGVRANSSGGAGGGGGGGGTGSRGAILLICTPTLINNGYIYSKGGVGGNGGNGGNAGTSQANCGGSGGGGGGSGGDGGTGGVIIFVFISLSGSGSILASGGVKGTKGSKGLKSAAGGGGASTAGADGVDGSDGSNGADGTIYYLQLT